MDKIYQRLYTTVTQDTEKKYWQEKIFKFENLGKGALCPPFKSATESSNATLIRLCKLSLIGGILNCCFSPL